MGMEVMPRRALDTFCRWEQTWAKLCSDGIVREWCAKGRMRRSAMWWSWQPEMYDGDVRAGLQWTASGAHCQVNCLVEEEDVMRVRMEMALLLELNNEKS
jgi:hypothetical protein